MRNNKVQSFLIILAMSLLITYQIILQVSPGMLSSAIIQNYNINLVSFSVLSINYYYTYIILQIPAGMIVDKISKSKMLFSIALASILLMHVFFTATDFFMGSFARVGLGIVNAPAVALAYSATALVISKRFFATATGLLETMSLIGLAALIWAVEYSGSAYFNLSKANWICATFGIVIILITLLIKFPKPASLVSSKTINVFAALRSIMSKLDLWIAGIYSGLLFVPISVFAPIWLVPFLKSVYAIDGTQAGFGSICMLLGAGIGILIICPISDFIKERKKTMIFSALAGFLFAFFIIYCPPLSLSNMYLLLFGYGLTLGAYMLPYAYIKDSTNENVCGTAMGFANMLCFIGGAPIIQPIIALILTSQNPAAATGGLVIFEIQHYQTALSCFLCTSLLSAFIACFLKYKYSHSSK